jgi:hypothetical protein
MYSFSTHNNPSPHQANKACCNPCAEFVLQYFCMKIKGYQVEILNNAYIINLTLHEEVSLGQSKGTEAYTIH